MKSVEKHFCNLIYKKKNVVKLIENLPQHLSEKFIGDNLSITDIQVALSMLTSALKSPKRTRDSDKVLFPMQLQLPPEKLRTVILC